MTASPRLVLARTKKSPVPAPAGAVAVAAAGLLLGACASLPTARIELPPELQGRPVQVLEGAVGVPRGDYRLGAASGRFERSASRLSLFDVVTQDRATLSFTVEPEGLRAQCKLLANTGTVGIVQAPLKRAAYACDFTRDGQSGGQPVRHRLELRATDTAMGTREERRGRFEAGGVVLELESLHRVQGSPLPLSAPVGYAIRAQGQTIAALDLNDLKPRLWQREASGPTAAAVTQAAVALALLWDPASN